MVVKYATASAGLKTKGKEDILIVYFEKPLLVSALYTQNHFKAESVKYSMNLTKKRNRFRAFVVNSGNANCGTGKEGYKHAQLMAETVAKKLGISREEVLVFSTGIIGVKLPIERVLKAIEEACEELRPLKNEEDLKKASWSIATTDRFPKISIGEYSYGFGKGAGMIHPKMATMLAFVFLKEKVDFPTLKKLHREINEESFNSITVDGCTSTNDSFLLICTEEEEKNISYEDLRKDLLKVSLDIAKSIVADGEGATKIGVIKVLKASTKEKAKRIAEKIATSNLVKTALFGRDPNWGRILASASSVENYPIFPEKIEIYIGNFLLFKNGEPQEFPYKEVKKYMEEEKEIEIKVVLNEGEEQHTYYTSDLTYDYVKLNAEYTT